MIELAKNKTNHFRPPAPRSNDCWGRQAAWGSSSASPLLLILTQASTILSNITETISSRVYLLPTPLVSLLWLIPNGCLVCPGDWHLHLRQRGHHHEGADVTARVAVLPKVSTLYLIPYVTSADLARSQLICTPPSVSPGHGSLCVSPSPRRSPP